jgi:hypothetical protein
LAALLIFLAEKRASGDAGVRKRASALQAEIAAHANDKRCRFYAIVEDGVTDFDDVLRDIGSPRSILARMRQGRAGVDQSPIRAPNRDLIRSD